MQTSISQSSSPGAQKDAIALFFFRRFFQGQDCVKPDQLRDEKHFILAQSHLSQNVSEFRGLPPTYQKRVLSQSVESLMRVLNCYNKSVIDQLLDELSPTLAEVFNGQSETFRPFLDVLIKRGVYPDPDLTLHSHQIGPEPMDIKDAKRAWGQEYQGRAHILLLENIQRSFSPSQPYANSGSIIQSSGYGKSRTVDNMATLIPTIPMNVRAESEAMQGAFPPADTALIEIFKGMTRSENPVERLFFFFTMLFERVYDLARKFEGNDFTASLYHHFSDQEQRDKFYTDLLKIMKSNPRDANMAEVVASFENLVQLLPESKGLVKMIIYVDEAHTLASQNADGKSLYDHMLKATAELADIHVFFLFLSTASRLEVLASRPSLSNSARFRSAASDLVAPFTEMPFDCHPLLVKPIRPGLKLEEIQKFSFAVRFGRPLFWAYYEAMLKNKTAVRAHLATLSNAQVKLVGTTSLSMPEDPGKLAILDTLLNLEYDLRRTHSNQLESTMVASHLRTVYAVSPSRAYMHTGYPSEPVLAEAALTFVNSTRENPNMDQTTNLKLDTEQTSSLGPGMKQPTSNEPPTSQTDSLKSLIALYTDVDKGTAGAIDKGERGENVGKMILLMAYIAAVKRHSQSEPNKQFWGDGCSLVDFLTELTGDQFCHGVLVSVPDNVANGPALQDRFKKSWVRFTHFARAADDSAMTSSMAWIAFIRGMAMIGWHSQKVVDVNIPILLDKDQPITEANMSSVLVQFKVRTTRTAQNRVAVHEEEIKYFPPPKSRRDSYANSEASDDARTEYHTRPYISLVMELGLVPQSGNGSIPSKVVDLLDNSGSQPLKTRKSSMPVSSNVETPHNSDNEALASKRRHKPNISVSNVHASSLSRSASARLSGHIHPRYSLFYYGCSHKVYRCIHVTDEATCRTLLQIPTVFNDRPIKRPIDPVLQMKPFWNAGPNCFSWIVEPYFDLNYRENELEDDEVWTGNGEPMEVDEEFTAMDESP